MDDPARILVMILAAFLALVLLLSIIALVKLIQVLNYLKEVSHRAASVAHNIESASAFFEKTAAPIALGKLLANISSVFGNRKGKKG